MKGLGAPDEGIVEEGRRGATPALDVLDAHLAASGLSWLAGADFTLADLGFVPYLQALCDAGCEDLLEARPSLYAWFGRCRARPTWQAAVANVKHYVESPMWSNERVDYTYISRPYR